MVASGRSSFQEEALRGYLSDAFPLPCSGMRKDWLWSPPWPAPSLPATSPARGASGTRRVPPRRAAERVCHENGSDLGCCPPRDRLRRSRRAGRLLAPTMGHEGCLARSRGVWRTGASRNMEPVPPNVRTNRVEKPECPASRESPNWRTRRESAPGRRDKTFLKITAGWGSWTFRPRTPRSRPRSRPTATPGCRSWRSVP